MKSKLRAQLADTPICKHKAFVEYFDAIELLVSLIGMAYCLPNKHENYMTSINLVDAQLELDN